MFNNLIFEILNPGSSNCRDTLKWELLFLAICAQLTYFVGVGNIHLGCCDDVGFIEEEFIIEFQFFKYAFDCMDRITSAAAYINKVNQETCPFYMSQELVPQTDSLVGTFD